MGLPGARETFPATGRACPAAQWLLNFGRMCFASLIFAFSGLRLVCHGIESGRAPPHQRLWRARHIARIFAPELVPARQSAVMPPVPCAGSFGHAGLSRAPPAPTPSSGTNCAPCGGCSGSRTPSHPTFSRPSVACRSARAGAQARLGFKAHPHILRHAYGYALANKGHDTRTLQSYLGHRTIQHTVRYTELSPTRFKDFRRD